MKIQVAFVTAILLVAVLGGSWAEAQDRVEAIGDDPAGDDADQFSRPADLEARNPLGLAFAALSYFGGSGLDNVNAIRRDGEGFLYVAGTTSSRDLPGLMVGLNGAQDAFVAKLSPDGQRVMFVRLLGGSDLEAAYVMSAARDGKLWVAGVTMSRDFPLVNSAQDLYGGSQDVFVSQVDTATGALVSSTYLGGSDVDFPGGIAVDGTGRCWVTGTTNSKDFPLERPVDDTFGGGTEAFATCLSANSFGIDSSTLIGGSKVEFGAACDVDANDNIVMCGATTSPDFPTRHPFQSVLWGGQDAFVLRLAKSGDAILSSSLLGGERIDGADGLCVDKNGYVYIVGTTRSREFPFRKPLQPRRGGMDDGFVTKMDPECRRLIYSTYLGGSAGDHLKSVSVGDDGACVVSGLTFSSDLAVVRAPQQAYGGGFSDGFVAKLSASGAHLVFLTYVGGQGVLDVPDSVTSAKNGESLIAGFTDSIDLPVVNAFQEYLAGQEFNQPRDAFFGWILDPQDFQISLAFQAAEIHAGGSLDVDVGVIREPGLDDPIAVSLADERAIPIRGGVSQTNLGDVVRLQFRVRRSARPGKYRVPIIAEDVLGRSRSVTLHLEVLP